MTSVNAHPHRRLRSAPTAPPARKPADPLDTPVVALPVPPAVHDVLDKRDVAYVRDLVRHGRTELLGPDKLDLPGLEQLRKAVLVAGAVPPSDWYTPPPFKPVGGSLGGMF